MEGVLCGFGLCTELCVHCHSPVPEHSRQPRRNGTARVVHPQTPPRLASAASCLLSVRAALLLRDGPGKWNRTRTVSVSDPPGPQDVSRPARVAAWARAPFSGTCRSGESDPFCGAVCPRPVVSHGPPRQPAQLWKDARWWCYWGGEARLREVGCPVGALGPALWRRGAF